MWGVMRYRLLDIVPIARDVVIHNMRDGVIVVNNLDLIIDLNRTARQLSGIKDNNVIGVSAERIIPWWRSMIQRRNWDQMTVPPIMDVCIEGQNRMIQVSRSSLFNNGKTLGFMITLHDVTANQQVEIALRESEERFKSLSENAPVIIFSLDVNGALNYVNPAWESLLGYSRQEALGRLLVDFIPEIQIRFGEGGNFLRRCIGNGALIARFKKNIPAQSFRADWYRSAHQFGESAWHHNF
jgi:PAS domain S-box-containing protein